MTFDYSETPFQVAEVELLYRSTVKSSMRPVIRKSEDAYKLLTLLWDSDKLCLIEQAKVVFLNKANKILGFINLSTGGSCGTIVDPRIVLTAALRINAFGIILCHNHPSGNLQPSASDIRLTNAIAQAGAFLDIRVLDHLIITDETYYSFADEGAL